MIDYCQCQKPSCKVCQFFAKHPELRIPLVKCCDCQHLGDELTYAQREALQLPHGKVWHECEAGLGPVAKCHQSRCEQFMPKDVSDAP
jgi:hypothetical protein